MLPCAYFRRTFPTSSETLSLSGSSVQASLTYTSRCLKSDSSSRSAIRATSIWVAQTFTSSTPRFQLRCFPSSVSSVAIHVRAVIRRSRSPNSLTKALQSNTLRSHVPCFFPLTTFVHASTYRLYSHGLRLLHVSLTLGPLVCPA